MFTPGFILVLHRYYGLYARHRDTDKKIHRALAKISIVVLISA